MSPILVYFGRCQEGLEWIAKAKRLNPFPPALYHWYHALAFYSVHDYKQAINSIKTIRSITPRFHAYLAACYAQQDMMNDARAEMSEFLGALQKEFLESNIDPTTIALGQVSEWAKRYRIPSDREHFLVGLRKAGLPE